jgi:uncharacterized protein (TIGR03083 family)
MTAEVLRAAYRAFADVVTPLGEDDSWRPTGCTGWSVRDLVFHSLVDAQRGLVGLHTPADRAPDTDAVSYWQEWKPDRPGAANARRWIRVSASMFPEFVDLRDLYLETAAATVTAAGEIKPDRAVATQGHVLTAADLLTTLAVETTVHHLDMVTDLPAAPPPSPAGLAAVRATLDGLLGYAVPLAWSDEHYALAGTGRTPLTDSERSTLGPDAGRFPLFG